MCLIWAADPHQDLWCHSNSLNIHSYSFNRLKTTQWHLMMCFPESSEPVCEDRAGQLDDGDQLGRLHVWPHQAGVRVFRSGRWKPLCYGSLCLSIIPVVMSYWRSCVSILKDPEKRPTAEQILERPVISRVRAWVNPAHILPSNHLIQHNHIL